jgi:hypothetical protein
MNSTFIGIMLQGKKTVSLAEERDLEDKVMVGFMRRQFETGGRFSGRACIWTTLSGSSSTDIIEFISFTFVPIIEYHSY